MPKPSAKIASTAIEVSHLSVRYGDVTVLDDVSFRVAPKTIVAVIGPNGSGKTTLMKSILGLVPSDGQVTLFGNPRDAMQSRVGYVPQRFDFDRSFPLTVREFLNLARHAHTPVAHIDHAITDVALPTAIADRRLGTLSGGQLQRVLIAHAIMNDPAILFLDEPSTGIDVAGEAAVYDVLEHLRRAHGTTIFLVSHDLAMIADVVDEVICVNQRVLGVGKPDATLTPKKLSELYGGRAVHIDHGHRH